MDIKQFQLTLREFAKARGWEQYHSPKNLAMALIVEAAELVELYQWLSEEEARALKGEALEDELADILLYLLRLADITGIDLEKAALNKIKKNAVKYPTTGNI